MKSSALLDDARRRPELFHWNGPIDERELHQWLHDRSLADKCPADIIDLWQTTGGGDFLESETILGPLGETSMGDNLMGVNLALRERGLSDRFLVFHLGICMSAIDLHTGKYVELDDVRFNAMRRFCSLNDWYLETVRIELGERYGLI